MLHIQHIPIEEKKQNRIVTLWGNRCVSVAC